MNSDGIGKLFAWIREDYNRQHARHDPESDHEQGNVGLVVVQEHLVAWACSSRIRDRVQAFLESQGGSAPWLSKDRNGLACSAPGDANGARAFPTAFPAPNPARTGDSEYLALNYVDSRMTDGQLPASAHVHLFSELEPCNSCSLVIAAFLGARTQARLTVHVLNGARQVRGKPNLDALLATRGGPLAAVRDRLVVKPFVLPADVVQTSNGRNVEVSPARTSGFDPESMR